MCRAPPILCGTVTATRIELMKYPLPSLVLLLAAGPLYAGITAGQNLLTNGSATGPLTDGWTILAAGGQGWARTGSGGNDSVGGYFITSHQLCQRSQTIDLLAKGATAAELDAAPPIRVSEAISSYVGGNNGTTDYYYLRVELRDAAGNAIARWDAGTSAAMKTVSGSWITESHEFRDYGPGVRSIYFEDGGRDGGNWLDHYGSHHDAARVEILNQPVTDITLTPATFPSNVPAGGLAGQLRATDGDNLTHTFTLEPEFTTTTQTLLAAGAADWRYLDTGVAPAADWTTVAFDDSAWGTGAAPLGYDSGGTDTWQVTKVSYGATATAKPLTTWFRKTFTVTDPAAIVALNATLMVDDGCVVYLNGTELFRDGIDPAAVVTDATAANRTVSGADESDYDPFVIPSDKLSLLVPGTNTLAVEVHQDKIGSSDISIDLTLTASVADTVNNYSNDLFQIAGSELRVKDGSAGLAPGTYTVRVKAVDVAGNAFTKLLTTERTGQVFTSAPTGFSLTAASLPENTPAGALIGEFTATDADSSDAHAYALVTGPGGEDNASVSISDNRLFVVQPPDYETRSSLSLLVSVTDSAGLSFLKALTVPVTDDTTEDADGDGLTEAEEDINNNGVLDPNETDPALADTDGDTYSDRVERNGGSDPRDPASVPSAIELLQTVTHVTGDSWLTAASWAGGEAPQAIHITVTDNLTLRPPPVADPVFPGSAIDLRNGAVFRLKHTGLAAVSRIILRNAMIQQGMTVPISVGGPGARLEVPASGTLDTAGVELDLAAGLSGAGTIRVIGTTAGILKLEAPAQGFTGDLLLENPTVILADATAAGNVRRIQLKGSTLRADVGVDIPDAVIQRSGTGKLSLSSNLTVGAFVVNGLIIPPGSYTGAALLAAGAPADAVEDNGGTLTITGNPASLDTDGDGAGDLFEILSGTNPAVAGDALKLASLTPLAGDTFRVQWTAVPGVAYTVQSATTLDGLWQDLTVVIPSTAAGTYDAVLTAPLPPAVFFRLALK